MANTPRWLLVDNPVFDQPLDMARISVAAVGERWEEVERELGLPEQTLAAMVHTVNRYATSGLPRSGHGYSSGMSLADCTFFGRQAGRNAAMMDAG